MAESDTLPADAIRAAVERAGLAAHADEIVPALLAGRLASPWTSPKLAVA